MAARKHAFLGQMLLPQSMIGAYKAKISPNQPLFKVKSCPGSPKSGNASLGSDNNDALWEE
jgi:hypothetical protein